MTPIVVHLLTLLLTIPPGLGGLEPPAAASGSVSAPGPAGPPGPVGTVGTSGPARSVSPGGAPGSVTGVWPLVPQPVVVAGFDPPLFTYGAGHRGVDLAGSPGQTVRAAAAGRVTFAGSIAGRGVVVVSHGATRTTYEPVHASVKVGTVVAAGDRIGTLQDAGSHCWPDICLHWGLIEGDVYLDPLTLVGAGPVRLLPLFGTAPDQAAGAPH